MYSPLFCEAFSFLPFNSSHFMVVSASASFAPGSYAVIPCTFNPGNEAQFQLFVMPDQPIANLVELKDAAVLSINVLLALLIGHHLFVVV